MIRNENSITDADQTAVENCLTNYAKNYPVGQIKQDLPQVYYYVMGGKKC